MTPVSSIPLREEGSSSERYSSPSRRYPDFFAVVNPMIKALEETTTKLEADVTAQEVKDQQEIQGLKAQISEQDRRINALEAIIRRQPNWNGQIARLRDFAKKTSDKPHNHTHNIQVPGVGTATSFAAYSHGHWPKSGDFF